MTFKHSGAEDIFCESVQRFDLRKAAGQIASQFIALATKELTDNSVSVLSKLTYCFDGDEATFISGKSETPLAQPHGDYFIATEGVLIEISATASPGYKAFAGDIDSAYFYFHREFNLRPGSIPNAFTRWVWLLACVHWRRL